MSSHATTPDEPIAEEFARLASAAPRWTLMASSCAMWMRRQEPGTWSSEIEFFRWMTEYGRGEQLLDHDDRLIAFLVFAYTHRSTIAAILSCQAACGPQRFSEDASRFGYGELVTALREVAALVGKGEKPAQDRAPALAVAAENYATMYESYVDVCPHEAAIGRIRSLHTRVKCCDCKGCENPDECDECGLPWPCPTIRTLDPTSVDGKS